jgi:dinuclear metal center YbgI/SA1388 family protein
MSATVAEIIEALEAIAPTHLAEPWDNPGLQVGNRRWPVKKILISLDPTPHVLNYAAGSGVDMVITHHPLLFKPLKSIDLSTPLGGILCKAIQKSIAVYAAHTNLDSAQAGLNDMLADCLALKNVTVLAPRSDVAIDAGSVAGGIGLGRIGELSEPKDLLSVCETLKHSLNLENVRLVGDKKSRISRVALCTGSGSSLLDRFFSSGADVYITGDVRYHDARDAEDRGTSLIDIGHFGSEHLMVDRLADRLRKVIGNSFPDVEIRAFEGEKDPFVVV